MGTPPQDTMRQTDEIRIMASRYQHRQSPQTLPAAFTNTISLALLFAEVRAYDRLPILFIHKKNPTHALCKPLPRSIPIISLLNLGKKLHFSSLQFLNVSADDGVLFSTYYTQLLLRRVFQSMHTVKIDAGQQCCLSKPAEKQEAKK